jgi:hypothetical protein
MSDINLNKDEKEYIVYPPYILKEKYLKDLEDIILKNKDNTHNYWKSYPDIRDKIFWSILYRSIDEKYDKDPYIIDKGTIVYHTNMKSDMKDYFISKQRNIVYFGLDINICLWYALEVYIYLEKFDKEKLENNKYFYLHIYSVKRPIRYKYNPYKDNTIKDIKESKNIPYVGSQTVFHGNNYYELGTEMTIPYKLIRKKLSPVKSYRIDIIKLLEIRGKGILNILPEICLTIV